MNIHVKLGIFDKKCNRISYDFTVSSLTSFLRVIKNLLWDIEIVVSVGINAMFKIIDPNLSDLGVCTSYDELEISDCSLVNETKESCMEDKVPLAQPFTVQQITWMWMKVALLWRD